MNIFCILKEKHTRKTNHPWKLIPSRKPRVSATAMHPCVGPCRVHEFQILVRNYLFCWTLAEINHPLGGWCQLRASVMQKGYFYTLFDTKYFSALFPPLFFLPSFCPTTLVSVNFFFHSDSTLEVLGYNKSNCLCHFSTKTQYLSCDFSSPHMISQV